MTLFFTITQDSFSLRRSGFRFKSFIPLLVNPQRSCQSFYSRNIQSNGYKRYIASQIKNRKKYYFFPPYISAPSCRTNRRMRLFL